MLGEIPGDDENSSFSIRIASDQAGLAGHSIRRKFILVDQLPQHLVDWLKRQLFKLFKFTQLNRHYLLPK